MTLIQRSRRPGAVARGAATVIALMAMIAGALTACGSDRNGDATGHSHTGDTQVVAAHDTNEQTALRVAMRSLWAQHMEWTYATVVAFASDSPALQATLTRLLRNQNDIGGAVTPYYGTEAGKKLTDLLRTHIEEAVPVLTAAKAGDKAGLTTAVDAWYANAREIADFLASANPNWKKGEMRQMMKTHITQTIGYASDVLGGNYASAIDNYDHAEAHMLEMADMLTAGLVEQFPDKF
jgi:malate synthase